MVLKLIWNKIKKNVYAQESSEILFSIRFAICNNFTLRLRTQKHEK